MAYTKNNWHTGDIVTAAKLNHMEDGIAGVEADVSSLDTQLLASLPHDTASGSIASFPDGAAMPVIDCSVAVAPNQDLHGYDNPWPAGGGKNLFNADTYPTTTQNGITCTNNGDGSFTLNGEATADIFFSIFDQFRPNVGGTALPSATYRLTGGPTGGGNGTYYVYTTPNYHGDTGSGITFTDGITGGSIYVKSGQVCNNLIFKPMIRLASNGDDTFAPFSNICPISGWAECKVTRTGKNLWQFANAYTATGSSTLISNQALSASMKAGNYVLSCYGSIGNAAAFTFRDSENNALATVTLNSSALSNGRYVKSFTLPDTAVKLNLFTNNTLDINNIQVEVGTTATAFESPATPQVYTIDLNGTRYGGTLDVTTGKLTVDMKMVDMGSLEYVYNPAVPNFPFFAVAMLDMAGGTDKYLCSNYANSGQHASIAQVPDMACMTIGQQFRVRDSRYDNAATFKTAMSGVQLCYELATPIEVDLTPTEISTLYGTNNIFADCGNTTVDYYADTTLFVNKKIAAAVAALS